MSVGFMLLYSKLADFLSTKALFYTVIIPFIAFFGAFGFLLYRLSNYFQELYRWKKEHTDLVMDMWRAKMIDRVRDSVHELKRAVQMGKKVLWCDDETEEALKMLWKS
ncbi:ADP,ATP carrier protein 1, chloroplastic-like protein [Drosera capensis]